MDSKDYWIGREYLDFIKNNQMLVYYIKGMKND